MLRKNVSLLEYNTLGIQAFAAYFFCLSSQSDLLPLSKFISKRFHTPLVLGQGSNIFFSRNFSGLVIKNELQGIKILRNSARHLFVEVSSGVIWDDFIAWTLSQNLGGLENLSMIPGTVGAAPVQNIGAYGVEVESCIEELEFFEWETHSYRWISKEECRFDYRNSIFKKQLKGRGIITKVRFKLQKAPHNLHITYHTLSERMKYFLQMNKAPTIQRVSACVRAIRSSKLPDPIHLPNVGSFFKNPIISYEKLQNLQIEYPDIPCFKQPLTQHYKISAAWLIDQVGLRGLRREGVAMYFRQPLVLVNYGATQPAVRSHIIRVQKLVYDRFNLNLVPEVNIV